MFNRASPHPFDRRKVGLAFFFGKPDKNSLYLKNNKHSLQKVEIKVFTLSPEISLF